MFLTVMVREDEAEEEGPTTRKEGKRKKGERKVGDVGICQLP